MADFYEEDDLFDGEEAVDFEEGLQWDDDAILNDSLLLDRVGFEAEELANKAPYIDYAADFANYMASEALFTVFAYWEEELPAQLREDFEAVCQRFVKNTLAPAVEGIGGWGWFDSCRVSLSFDMIAGDIWLTLTRLTRSDIEHDPNALTEYAPVEEKKALRFDGETDIEVDKAMVEVEAEMDNGEGDLAEWIFDSMTNNLQIAGRGNVNANDMDQIADKCADICGQDIEKFDTLKFHVDNDGNIAAFDFNGSHYGLDL